MCFGEFSSGVFVEHVITSFDDHNSDARTDFNSGFEQIIEHYAVSLAEERVVVASLMQTKGQGFIKVMVLNACVQSVVTQHVD